MNYFHAMGANKAKIHHWIGRAIALLGLAQVPLGLTLYGSPRVLFVLYALVVFVLLVTYFILSHRHDRRGNDYDSRYSYGSGSAVQERRRSSGIGGLAAAGAAGIGIAALANRFRHRSRSRGSHPEVVGSRRHSGSFIEEEKYSRHGKDDRRQDGWKDKLLKVGAIAGALALVKQLMGSKNNHDRESDVDEYTSRVGGASTVNPHVQRMEEGRPLPGVQRPLNQSGGHRRSTSSLSYSSYTSAAGERRRSHGLGGTVAGLGALGLARNIFKGRRERKEQRRLEAQRQKEIDNERRARAKNQRYTGDGYPHRNGRRASVTTSTDLSASTDDRPRYDGGMPPPVPAGVFPAGAAGAAIAGQSSQRSRQTLAPNPSQPAIPMYSATAPLSNPPILPGPAPIPAMPPGPGSMPPIPTIPPAPGPALVPPPPAGQVSMPPVPPDPQGLFHPESSGSEAYVSPGGRNHRRHSGRNQAVGAAAGAAAGVTAGASSSRQDRHHSGSGGSVASPPVSVKVKMHSDGRHVTLRRLPEEEAAAERQRRSKDRHGKRRRGSFSSLGEPSGGSDRWRRTGTLEQQQAEVMRIESENLAAARNQTQIPPPQNVPMPLPPPPPIPGSSVGPRPGTASVGSPGTYDGEVTEASADYANNRRRRRAERAQAKQAREARMGNNVDFS